ncbi:hypothetical protein ACFL4G_04875, partial [Thermodesulfobacteriota bacterium]
MNPWRERAWLVLSLALSVGLFVFLLRDRFDYEGFWEFFPFRLFVHRCLAQGIAPFWMPEVLCGFPLHAAGETGLANPLNLLAIWPGTYLVLPMLTLAVCGVFTFLFFRRLGADTRPAALMALPCVLGPTHQYWFSNVNDLFVLALFPVALYLTEVCLSGRRRFVPLLLGGVLAWMFLSGHPPLAYFNIIVLGLYVLLRLPFLKTRRVDKAGALLVFSASVFIGAALSAFQLVPMLEFLRESPRVEVAQAFREIGSMTPAGLSHLVVPRIQDFTQLGEVNFLPYLGMLPLFALVLCWRHQACRRSAFLWLTAVATLVLAMGHSTPAYRLLSLLPGFAVLRKSYFFVGYMPYFLCGLAALILTAPMPRSLQKTPLSALLIAVYLVLGGLALWRYDSLEFLRETNARPWFMLVITGIPSIFMVWLLRRSRTRVTVMLAGLLLLTDLLGYGLWRVPAHEESIFDTARLGPSPWVTRIASGGMTGERVAFIPRDVGVENYSESDYSPSVELDVGFGVRSFWGWDEPSLKPARAVAAADALLGREVSVAYLSAANVGYIRSEIVLDDPALIPLSSDASGTLYRNRTVLPRAFLAAGVRVVAGFERALAAIRDEGVDLRREALVEGQVDVPPRASWEPVDLVEDLPGRAVMGVSTREPALLVFTETFFPGWRVRIDGHPSEILPTNLQFMGIIVPPGDHRVAFTFEPASVRIGLWISLVSFFVCLAVALLI